MSGVIWVCDECGKRCKDLQRKLDHEDFTGHKTYTPEDQNEATCTTTDTEETFSCSYCNKLFRNVTKEEMIDHIQNCPEHIEYRITVNKQGHVLARTIDISDDVVDKIADKVAEKLIKREIETCAKLEKMSVEKFKEKYNIPDDL